MSHPFFTPLSMTSPVCQKPLLLFRFFPPTMIHSLPFFLFYSLSVGRGFGPSFLISATNSVTIVANFCPSEAETYSNLDPLDSIPSSSNNFFSNFTLDLSYSSLIGNGSRRETARDQTPSTPFRNASRTKAGSYFRSTHPDGSSDSTYIIRWFPRGLLLRNCTSCRGIRGCLVQILLTWFFSLGVLATGQYHGDGIRDPVVDLAG